MTVRVVDQPNKVTVVEDVVTVQVASVGVQGPPGSPGVEISATEPTNTSILWADTSEPGDEVIPPGGGTGDVLAKVSSNDYDSDWVTRSALAGDTAFTSAFADIDTVPTGGATGQVLVKASGTNYDTAWDNPKWSWPTATGQYYGPPTAVSSSSATSANRISAIPMFFPRPTAIDRIAFRMTAGGAAGSLVRLGVYESDSDGLPGDLIHDFGTVDGTVAANPAEITVSVTLDGFVWLAARYNGESPVVIVSAAVTSIWTPANSGMTVHGGGVLSAVQSSGDALIDPFPISTATTGTTATIIRVRAA